MTNENRIPEIDADDFARRFSQRERNLMWFLGAGASAAAGIPTAADMIADFKQQLYISQLRISAHAVAELSNPVIRARLQAHIDSSGNLPAAGSPDEYAALFETLYPAEADRRTYIDAKVSGGKPSYGHMALATLMLGGRARIVWTLNFDPLVADACAKVYGRTGALTTATLDTPEIAAQCINADRWPVEVKLHGDFRSRRLKNTSDELRLQDQLIRRTLIDACRRFGLVVVGYSGRDDSIMDALEEAAQQPGAFPAGLFWLHRGEDPPMSRVETLLNRATAAGVEAALVRVENFDEALRDLIRLSPGLDMKALDAFAADRSRRTPAAAPAGRKVWPVVRLNALEVQAPTVCRRVVCDVGGHSEALEAVERAGVNVLIGRVRAGVLAYGADNDVRAAFSAFNIRDFDLHSIEVKRLRYESGERGLLRDALTRAIAREREMYAVHRRNADLLAPSDPQAEVWQPLRRLVKDAASGGVKGFPELCWREGVGVRLDWADDRLWLLFEPRVVFDGISRENKDAATDFARERTVRRYNPQLNELLTFWANLLAGDGSELRALNVGNGVDAAFTLSADTAFSWRVAP